MSDPFIGEIRAFPYAGFIPPEWLLCNGSLHDLRQYPPLYAIIGTRFGGDGKTTFAVPNLQAKVPVNVGTASAGRGVTNLEWSRTYGSATASSSWPAHTHQLVKHPPLVGGAAQKVATPSPNTELAQFSNAAASVNFNIFVPNGLENTSLSPTTLQPWGDGPQAHENRQPHLNMWFGIAWTGIFPVKP